MSPFEEEETEASPAHVEQSTPAARSASRQQQEEEQRAAAQEELAYELARLKRLGIFSTFVAVVMMSFVFLPIIFPIVLIMGGCVYVVLPCLPLVFVTKTTTTTTVTEKQLESSVMLENATDIHHDNADVNNVNFDETRAAVRGCERARLTAAGSSLSPVEGIYKVVYAAEYFGRALRSEGEVALRFTPQSNGWDISGHSRSTADAAGGPVSRIRDGFVNAEGEMYWLVDGESSGKLLQYRGTLNLDTNELYDGEFSSKDNSLQGRIVRLYLLKATTVELMDERMSEQPPQHADPQSVMDEEWGTTDIEMVAKSHNLPAIS